MNGYRGNWSLFMGAHCNPFSVGSSVIQFAIKATTCLPSSILLLLKVLANCSSSSRSMFSSAACCCIDKLWLSIPPCDGAGLDVICGFVSCGDVSCRTAGPLCTGCCVEDAVVVAAGEAVATNTGWGVAAAAVAVAVWLPVAWITWRPKHTQFISFHTKTNNNNSSLRL